MTRETGTSLAIHVALERLPSDDVQRLIDKGLDIFNAQKAGPDSAEDLWVIARDSGGHAQGGLKGRTFYSWLFIDWLWLSPAARGQRVGIQLIDRAETAAKERGCIGAYVDTFSFQAPDFYRHD